MQEAWNDLFVRTDARETGPELRYGGFGSPDIIPEGIQPKPPADYITEASYQRYYNNAVYEHQPNTIYVRAKNSSATSGKRGEAFLVMSNPAVVLWPGGEGWTRIKNGAGSYGSSLGEVKPGQIGITEEPFVFVPDESGHRCLVTWLSTPDHPVDKPPPTITEAEKLAKFLVDHPNYAHHNIDIAPDTTGVVTWDRPLDTGTKAGTWRFGLKVTNCQGFEVSFKSGTPLPNGHYIQMLPTKVEQDITYFIDVTDIPENFQTRMFCTYDQKNLVRTDFSVVYVAYLNTPPGHPLYERAVRYADLGASNDGINDRGIPLGSIGVMRGSVKG
jgi:hypothetical protein